MRDRLIKSLDIVVKIAVYITIIFFGLIGFSRGYNAGGFDGKTLYGITGLVIGLFIGWIIAVITFGVISILIDIREKLIENGKILQQIANRPNGPA